jgi:hypothetical protein
MKRITSVVSTAARPQRVIGAVPSTIIRAPSSVTMMTRVPLRRVANLPSSSSSSSSARLTSSSSLTIAATTAAVATTLAVASTVALATDNDNHEHDHEDDDVNEARVASTIVAAREAGQPRLTPEQAKKLLTERLLQFAASAEAGDADSQVALLHTLNDMTWAYVYNTM